MNDKSRVEASLERSLRKQVVAPMLGTKFDAGVWSRIEAEEKPANLTASVSRAEKLSRWLFVSNVVGVLFAIGIAGYFGLRAFAGVDVGVSLSMPSYSAVTTTQIVTGIGYVLTLLTLGAAMSLTSFGRRLRASYF